MKRVIFAAILISIAALALTPLLQSTGLATAPLSELPKSSSVFLQNVKITQGSLIQLTIVRQIES
ncbi:MAG: hypothetical protein HY513_03950 [Candidatus Aenigmarchaeota archaeon]|nr:hypothetical protein [Candidatus Aenigmarchaeota archaeon]